MTPCVTCGSSEPLPRQIRQAWITRFDFLLGCLPGREAPTDVDQLIEKNGHFLFIEAKRPGQKIPRGQIITLNRLAALPSTHVLLVEGNPPDTLTGYGWWKHDIPEVKPACVHHVRSLVRRWRDWAEAEAA